MNPSTFTARAMIREAIEQPSMMRVADHRRIVNRERRGMNTLCWCFAGSLILNWFLLAYLAYQ